MSIAGDETIASDKHVCEVMKQSQVTNMFVKQLQVMKSLAMIAGGEMIATSTSDDMACNDWRR